jgi:hypothetical protein
MTEENCMPTYIRVAEPKTFPPQQLVLGIPLAIWAVSLLLIAAAAYFNVPLGSFDPPALLAPF